MMGAPESYEKNQNSYRARTRESAARRLYISGHRLADSHRRDERLRFGRRLGIELGREAPREVVVDHQRPCAVAHAVQQSDQRARQAFVERGQPCRAAGPLRRRGQVSGFLAPSGERPRRSRGGVLQPRPFGLQPALEFGRVRYEESVQQGTPVELERGLELPSCHRAIEVADIAPETIAIEADLFFTIVGQGLGPQLGPEDMQRLPQGGAGPGLVELRPEQRQQVIAAAHPARGGRGKVGKEGEPARLGQQAANRPAVRVCEGHRPEQPELDHMSVTAGVTGA